MSLEDGDLEVVVGGDGVEVAQDDVPDALVVAGQVARTAALPILEKSVI